jgi:hypothetical protein
MTILIKTQSVMWLEGIFKVNNLKSFIERCVACKVVEPVTFLINDVQQHAKTQHYNWTYLDEWEAQVGATAWRWPSSNRDKVPHSERRCPVQGHVSSVPHRPVGSEDFRRCPLTDLMLQRAHNFAIWNILFDELCHWIDYKECGLLGYGTMWILLAPKFQKNVSTPSSG